MNTKRRNYGILALLTILGVLVALPGCIIWGDHDHHRDRDHHEEHDNER